MHTFPIRLPSLTPFLGDPAFLEGRQLPQFITPFEYFERNKDVACFVRDFIEGNLSRNEIWNLKTRIMLRYRRFTLNATRRAPCSDRTIAVLRDASFCRLAKAICYQPKT